jgi:hypothetical protein
MSVLTETYTLSNGNQIPKIGFGTWLLKEGDECCKAVADALRIGYRHIDTARAYSRSVGSLDSTRPTPFKSVPSTPSSSRHTPRSRTASSSTIPRSATSQPATASARHNCASVTCCKGVRSCCPRRPRPRTSSRTPNSTSRFRPPTWASSTPCATPRSTRTQ